MSSLRSSVFCSRQAKIQKWAQQSQIPQTHSPAQLTIFLYDREGFAEKPWVKMSIAWSPEAGSLINKFLKLQRQINKARPQTNKNKNPTSSFTVAL